MRPAGPLPPRRTGLASARGFAAALAVVAVGLLAPGVLRAQIRTDRLDRADNPEEGEVSYTVEVKGCDVDPVGCFRRGKLLLEAKPDPAAPAPATLPREHPGLTLVLGACEAGHLPACTYGAQVLYDGQRVQKDRFQAAWFAQRACATLDPAACFIFGQWSWKAGIYDSIVTLAPVALVTACNGGYPEACLYVGMFQEFLRKDDPDSIRKAIEYYQRACDGQVAEACGLLGYALYYGAEEHRDRSRGHEVLQKSCEGLDSFGCLCFGVANIFDGLRGNPNYGIQLLRYACDRGERQACYFAGRVYQAGDTGVSQNIPEAVRYLEIACTKGEKRACGRLAFEYLTGRELNLDYRKGRDYAVDACGVGDMEGCSFLGALYEDGLGVDTDFDRAIQLYRIACVGGFKGGCDALKRLKVPVADNVERGCPSDFRYSRFDWCL
jgi:uncharacterized protein